MVLSDIGQLPSQPELAIIINVDTKAVTTLALLSSLRHTEMPTLLVDCESRDGSGDWFRKLVHGYDFHFLSAPLRPHGQTLDWILSNVTAERVLLIDSDVEVLNGEMLRVMRTKLNENRSMYGSGFLHEGGWLPTHYGTDLSLASGIGYYKERPWIPFVLLRAAAARLALSAGRSFMHQLTLNEFRFSPFLSKLAWRRFRFATFRKHRLAVLDAFRGSLGNIRPAYTFSDTGADIHEYLTGVEGLLFGSVWSGSVPWSIKHFQGTTRSVLQGESQDAFRLSEAENQVRLRLREEYGFHIQ